MTDFIWIFAAAKAGGTASFLTTFGPLIIIVILFYVLLIAPQRKREKQHQALLNSLKKGDKVITTSGLYGEVYSVAQDTIVLEVAPKVKLTFQRRAIAGMLSPDAAASFSPSSPSSSASSASPKASRSTKKKKK